HHHDGGRSAWRARSPVVPGQESRLVYGARRPQDAGDEHGTRSGAQRHRPQTLRDERLPPSRWESSGVAHWPGTPVQLDPLSVPGPERGPVWGGSGRRSRPDLGLDAQPANPHLRRVSVCACTSPPLNPLECEPSWLRMDDEEILLAYNAEMQGIANYYALATEAKKGLSKLLYIAEVSCLKTLAAKHQSTVRKM